MGVSVITHPKNPFIPTSHMNIRLFLLLNKKKEIIEWWVGGGYDLTPYFPYDKDCLMWHKDAKQHFDLFNKKYYKEFAKNCDDYFFLPHRKEKRGIGGVFFDNFNELDLDSSLEMLKNTSKTYLNSYLKIINLRKGRKYTAKDKSFQEYRRGRYAEFNLLYDRGTSFGLQSGGRTESILASLPPQASWKYKKDSFFIKNETKLLLALQNKWRG
jgi:coproporphyrinogen III oxidase